MRAVLAAGLACLLLAAPAAAQLPVPLPPGGGDGEGEPPAPPPPPVVAPGAAGDAWVTFGADAARRFASGDTTLVPPFAPLWTATMRGAVGYPLVADGMVFAADDAGVHAFDAATGARRWTAASGSARVTDLGYGAGRVFALDRNGVEALDTARGARLWRFTVDRGFSPSSPVVVDDTVYLHASGTLALDAATGAVRWGDAEGAGPTDGDLAVVGDRLYVNGGCDLWASDRRDGRPIWSHNAGCSGGGGGLMAAARDRVFPAEEAWGARRAEDGTPAGGPLIDVVVGDVGIETTTVEGRRRGLIAHDLAAGRELWRVPGAAPAIGLPAHLVSVETLPAPPAPSTGPGLVVRDLATGAERWSARILGDPADAVISAAVRVAPAAGGGIVIVPRDDRLIALAPVSRARPEPVTIEARGGAERLAGALVRLVGTTGAVLGARRTTLEVDAHPLDGGFARGAAHDTTFKGTYEHSLRVDRNTRVRVVTDDGRSSEALTLWAYPRLRLSIVQRRGFVYARVRFAGPRGVRARGRRVALYLGRRGSRRLRRLGTARLRGSGRRGRATLVFRPLPRTRANRRAYVIACLRGSHRIGLGRADLLSRRCGRRVLRF